ncbi:ubiquitin fusion degradation protein [Coemansia sp. RSA 552]|nr:ubiquitin fusion degradation protein [Coemansia sp. RSA 552]
MYDDSSDDDFDAFNPPMMGGVPGYQPPHMFGGPPYAGRQRQFRQFYSAYPIAAYHGGNKMDANYGGKIFMPPSALAEISQLEVVFPLLFKLQNDETTLDRGVVPRTHCGVLEFTAEEGRVYLPQWMMETLRVEPGGMIEAINVALLHGKLVKLQPQSTDFLDISDHRAVLENALRRYSALTVGDIISIEYNNREYRIAVLETQPSPSAINIVETDLSVDFAPPVGYVEPSGVQPSDAPSSSSISRPSSTIAKDVRRKEEAAKDEAASLRFRAFRGSGARLGAAATSGSGERPASSLRSYAATDDDEDKAAAQLEDGRPVPVDLPIGTLFFGYALVPPPGSDLKDVDPDNPDGKEKEAFQGQGRALRQRRKR